MEAFLRRQNPRQFQGQRKLVPDQLRKTTNDLFHHYRRGQAGGPPPGITLADQRYNLKVFPRVVQDETFPAKPNEGLLSYKDWYQVQDDIDAHFIKNRPEEHKKRKEKKEAVAQQKALQGWREAKSLTGFMYLRKGTGLHFVKVLGAGGMGLLSVYVSYDRNGTKRFWTVKRDKPGNRDVAAEKKMTSHFLRAPHIIQILNPDVDLVEDDEDETNDETKDEKKDEKEDETMEDADDDTSPSKRPAKQRKLEHNQAQVRKASRDHRNTQFLASIARKAGTVHLYPPTQQPSSQPAPPPPPPPPPKVGPTKLADDFPDTMIMEYLPRGSLLDWFRKLGKMQYEGKTDLKIPNRVLWDMMACFLKMCIAIEYHPVILVEDKSDSYFIPERLPRKPTAELGSNIVHFDIDANNVLIGDFDWEKTDGKVDPNHPLYDRTTDAHDKTPIFKLIDFGLAEPMAPKSKNRADPMRNWGMRRVGKQGSFMPEQFTREWNYIVDAADAQQPSTAGQYSWKSNLWQFALLMHIAITLSFHPHYAIHALRQGKLYNGAPSNLPDWMQPKGDYATYGMHLLDSKYDHVSIRLRHLVARCLCERPADRPDFEEIKEEIVWAYNHDTPEEKEKARQWCREHFERPPMPTVPEWTRVEAWTKQNAIVPFDEYERHLESLKKQQNQQTQPNTGNTPPKPGNTPSKPGNTPPKPSNTPPKKTGKTPPKTGKTAPKKLGNTPPKPGNPQP
ncbi:kinase-like domain-containing protein [Sordaria brevicollis]|uniref:Kinase-like domain-containing protein n=1 Tax=Sordaria brevicollis TaxID=83679 RepID=A0AAE0PKF4_SORBR|nr:kinase-like domain-containing protein [Sordaria brevicollis]